MGMQTWNLEQVRKLKFMVHKMVYKEFIVQILRNHYKDFAIK